MKEQTLLGLKDNIKEGDKPWSKMASPESVYDDIMVDSFNWIYEGILLRISDYSTLGISENTTNGVAKCFKLGE